MMQVCECGSFCLENTAKTGRFCRRAYPKAAARYREEVIRVNRATDREIDAAFSSQDQTK